ncbi:MAG: YihY/virulence factor BrkB family protein [Acetilactobacillus jinshanensis]
MTIRLKLRKWIKLLNHHCKSANLSDSAVVLAYYILFSLFPLLIILGSLLKIIDVRYGHLINSLRLLLPIKIYNLLRPVVYSALNDGGKEQLSLGLLITVWSASRMIAAFQRTVNQAYGVHKPNVIRNRIGSLLWMVVFILFIVGLTFFLVFGQMIIKIAVRYAHGSPLLSRMINRVQEPTVLIVLYAVISSFYYFVPTLKVKMRYIWFGTLISTVGLILLSKVFSIYLKYFSQSFSAYQALGGFIILMFWLYFFGLVILFGAVLNATNQDYKEKITNQFD